MKRSHLFITLALLGALTGPGLADEPATGAAETAAPATDKGAAETVDQIELESGTKLTGSVVRSTDEAVWVATRFGEVRVERSKIKAIRRVAADEAAPDVKRAGPSTGARQPGAPGTGPAAQHKPDPAREAALQGAVVRLLESSAAADRVRGGKMVVESWPDSAAALDVALGSSSEQARNDATRLLEQAELGDQAERLRRAFRDPSYRVRRTAVRVVRRLNRKDMENELIGFVRNDGSWPVVQEALRTLEELGTVECLSDVVRSLERQETDDQRSRHLRVLRAITKIDVGEDPKDWDEALLNGAGRPGYRPPVTADQTEGEAPRVIRREKAPVEPADDE